MRKIEENEEAMSQQDPYTKKLAEIEQAKLRAQAESYQGAKKAVKWVAIGFFLFVFGGAFLVWLLNQFI